VDNQPHPLLPPAADWHGVMVIVILGSFLTAAMVGVIVRANVSAQGAQADAFAVSASITFDWLRPRSRVMV